jgi:steroid delta-isomerase-like uncharacterized protein
MSTEDTKRIAKRFIGAWNAGNHGVVDRLGAQDLIVAYPHFGGTLRGREAFKEVLIQTHEYFPDLQIQVDDVVAEAHRAVVHWRYHGSHRHGELFGIEASGRRVEVPGMTLYDIADGLVQQERGIVDNFALMMQLGAEPRPAEGE